MEFKGTKGEWKFVETTDYVSVIAENEKDGEFVVFDCLKSGEIENTYNAKLIAAAPELLEACEQLLSRFAVNDTWDKKAKLVAQAAIKKATENV